MIEEVAAGADLVSSAIAEVVAIVVIIVVDNVRGCLLVVLDIDRVDSSVSVLNKRAVEEPVAVVLDFIGQVSFIVVSSIVVVIVNLGRCFIAADLLKEPADAFALSNKGGTGELRNSACSVLRDKLSGVSFV